MQARRQVKVRIVTDTLAILPPGFAAAHDLQVVPQVVIFGEESFLEDVTITTEEFFRRLRTSTQLPKTAAPPPGEFEKAYRAELARAETIISIHPSSLVSGTVRSAQAAKEQWFPNADIRIIDTRSAAGCLGSMVVAAVEWAEGGLPANEIVRRVEDMMRRSRSYFLVSTLEYLQRGGRIGGAAALLGSVLQIKPLLELREGRVEVAEKVRLHSRAVERLIGLAVEQCPRSPEAHLCVMHADALAEARELAARLEAALDLGPLPVYHLGAVTATHIGPGVLAIGFFTA